MRRREACRRGGAVIAGVGLALALAAGPSAARTIGLRAGFTVSPGQWVVGLHEQLTSEDATVGVVPSAEAGFGSDAFSLTAQGDVVYRFPRTGGPRPYVGAGGAFYFYDPSGPGSDSNGGLNLVGGVVLDPEAHPRIVIDGRVRLTDRLPKARAVVGFEF